MSDSIIHEARVFIYEHSPVKADYVPILSSLTAGYDLYEKIFDGAKVAEAQPQDHYFTHLKESTLLRSVVLLIPVAGNALVGFSDLVVGIYHWASKKPAQDAPIQEKPPLVTFETPKKTEAELKQEISEEKESSPDPLKLEVLKQKLQELKEKEPAVLSSEKLLAEADAFLDQVNHGLQIENTQFELEEFQKKVTELRDNKDSKLHIMRFFLTASWMPTLATVKRRDSYGKLIVESMHAEGHERIVAIRRFLNSPEIASEDVNQPELLGCDNWSLSLLEEIMTGMPDLIDLALAKGADPNQRSEYSFGNTPLIWSIANDVKECTLELILACRRRNISIDMDKSSKFNGNTPLILCIAKGHERRDQMSNYELTEFLLNNGANPNIPDARGNTPMHYAFLRRDIKTIDLLCKHGAKSCLNIQGESPIDMLKKPYKEAKALLFEVTNADQDPQGCCSFEISKFGNITGFDTLTQGILKNYSDLPK